MHAAVFLRHSPSYKLLQVASYFVNFTKPEAAKNLHYIQIIKLSFKNPHV